MPAKKRLLVKGEEASVYRYPPVTIKGKEVFPRCRDVVRVSQGSYLRTARQMFYYHKLAQFLFPDNFIHISRLIEFVVPESRVNKELYESLSRPIREQRIYSRFEETTPTCKDFVEKYYALKKKRGHKFGLGEYRLPIELKDHPHLQLVERARPFIEEMKKAGICVNDHPVNIAQTLDGRIIFFEIHDIDSIELSKYLQRLPPAKRKKAKALLERLSV